jgi:nucleotide-binding universal stress UspA family protein
MADLMPWMGEGFMGGVQVTALESLKEAAVEGHAAVERMVGDLGYGRCKTITLESPVWAGLAMEGRLSDVIVFDSAAARGKGPLAEAFQQMVADEQRPVVVARPGLKVGGTVMVAWDGGKEASRAMRTALPLLQKAAKVVVAGAPGASSRSFVLERLVEFLAARGVSATTKTVEGAGGDAASLLLGAAKEVGADVLVAGAFGHPRLQEFIFGGTTRSLLNNDGPSLFLSH